MEVGLFVGSVLLAYLLGSIPSAVWLGKWLYNKDVRAHGSGNPGATNTFRVLGKKAGTIVMLADILKGLCATSLAVILSDSGFEFGISMVMHQLVLGVVAVLGHILPLFLNFKGGKGVATLLGMTIGLHWEIALVCVVVFLITLLVSKYVSLSSMIATLSFPLLLLLVPRFKTSEPVLIAFGFLLFIGVIWTHHKNIKRIFDGSENKAYLIGRKK